MKKDKYRYKLVIDESDFGEISIFYFCELKKAVEMFDALEFIYADKMFLTVSNKESKSK